MSIELIDNFPVTEQHLKDIQHKLDQEIKEMIADTVQESNNEDRALQRVWERQDEAEKTFIDGETFAEVKRLDVKALRVIAEEEGATLEKFLEYARDRSKKESSYKGDR